VSIQCANLLLAVIYAAADWVVGVGCVVRAAGPGSGKIAPAIAAAGGLVSYDGMRCRMVISWGPMDSAGRVPAAHRTHPSTSAPTRFCSDINVQQCISCDERVKSDVPCGGRPNAVPSLIKRPIGDDSVTASAATLHGAYG
jgi:hypothetical protein